MSLVLHLLIVNLGLIIPNSFTMPHSPEDPSMACIKQANKCLPPAGAVSFGITTPDMNLRENRLVDVKCRVPLGIGGGGWGVVSQLGACRVPVLQ